MKKQFKMGTGLVWGMVVLGGFLTVGAEEKKKEKAGDTSFTIDSSSPLADSDPIASADDTYGSTAEVSDLMHRSVVRVKEEVRS